jgi:hypothetical protein
MASLLGSADTTIVNAALKEAESKVVKDLSGVYDKREKALNDFNMGVASIFKGIADLYKPQEDILKEEYEKTINFINNDQLNDAIYELNTNQAKAFKQSMKDAGNDEEAVAKIQREYMKYNNAIQTRNKTLVEIAALGVDDQMLVNNGSPEQELLIEVLKDYNNNTNNTNVSYENGDIYYTLPAKEGRPEVKLTLGEMKKRLGTKSMTATVEINTAITSVLKDESTAYYQTFEKLQPEIYQNVLKSLKSENDILNVSKETFRGMNFSVHDLMTGASNVPDQYKNELMSEVFESLEKAGVDYDGVEGWTKEDEDMLTAENGRLLIDAVMKNTSLYRQIIANVISNVAGNNAYNLNLQNKKGQKIDIYQSLLNKEKVKNQ